MGTSNSKKTNPKTENENTNNKNEEEEEENKNQPRRSRFLSNDDPRNQLHPLRSYKRTKTLNPQHVPSTIKMSNEAVQNQKIFSKKFSESYCSQFKQRYMSNKENNTIVLHLVNSLKKNEKLTKEEIEYIRNKYLPKYIFDWRLEKDEKTGINYWKNHGKITLDEKVMNDIKKLADKQIGCSEPFYKKRAWLIHKISLTIDKVDSNPILVIDKNNILEDSYQQFTTTKDLNLKLPLEIYFTGLEVNEDGGVNRDWYSCLLKDIFSKERKLFRENPNDCLLKGTYLLHPKYPGMKMEYYEFIGTLLIKAFYDSITIKGYVINYILLNAVMKRATKLEDVKYYDLSLYKSLKEINDTNIKDNKTLSKIKFVWNIRDENNKLKEVELIPNGKKISLTDDNKLLFIDKVIYQEIVEPYKEQIAHLQKGCFQFIGNEIRGVFTIEEIKFLFCGQDDLDINDWIENTEYKGDYNENHKVIKMFWEKIKSLSKVELAKFLEFCTGLNNSPIDGFGALKGVGGRIQKFTIEPYINYAGEDKYEFRLIEAKTCFNRILLPQYKNKKEMDKAFDIILSSDSNFFGLE